MQTLTARTTPVAPVDAPVADTGAIEALTSMLQSTTRDTRVIDQLPVAAATTAFGTQGADRQPELQAAPITIQNTVINVINSRSSAEEFRRPPVRLESGKRSGLSDLEKVGLVALGALVAGAILDDGREVVSNTGDRVVVQGPEGGYRVYKDDDVLLRRPGADIRTETYFDGSTRTVVRRTDRTEVVTIRDVTGRVVRRATYDEAGTEIVLIDDLVPEEEIIVSELPRPRRTPITISSRDGDAGIKVQIAVEEGRLIGRSFSLRQIRDTREVRDQAATLEMERLTFDTGSAVIRATEVRKLTEVGQTMRDLLADNPREIFLIEGHTDAVGSTASNLGLSDRRAESVALALTEYFDIPPENMVVQGYGESELLVQTEGDERSNRRVGVRLISPLMRTAAN